MSGMSPVDGQGPGASTGTSGARDVPSAPDVPRTSSALTADAVATLAAEAVRDGPGSPADTRLRAVREQRVLEQVATTEDAPWAAELARDWATARQEALDLLAIHGQRGGRADAEADEVLDAMTAQLLTDPAAPGRLRRRLREAMAGQQPPPWFAAALDPDARVGRLLAAALLLREVQAAGATDTTERIPRVEGPAAGAAARDPASVGTARAPDLGRQPAATDTGAQAGAVGTGPRGSPEGTDRWSRAGGALVAPALALLVAAAGLRWPALTAAAVVAWLVVDRLGSILADPFLRLVGGWPPTIRGWSVLALPFRLLWELVRGPWRLLGGLLLLVLWGVVVDRGLTWLHPLLGGVSGGVAAMEPTSFTSRWFVPVAAAGVVWQVTRRRGPRPALRGAAALGGVLRSLPAGVAGLLIVPAVALVLVAARTPAEQPWAPYADHRAAVQAWLPGEGWWEAGRERWAGLTDRLPDLPERPGALLPGDEAPASRWQVVDASALNVRAGPSTEEPVVDSLPRGAVAEGTGRTETVDGALWVELQRPDGGTGWAAGRFLTELDG